MSNLNASTSAKAPQGSEKKKHDIGLSEKERIFVHALRALFDPKGKEKSVEEVKPKGYVSGRTTASPSEKKGVASGSRATGGRGRVSKKQTYRTKQGKGNRRETRSTTAEGSSEKKKLSPSEVKRAEKRADKRKAYKTALHPSVAKASTVKKTIEKLPISIPSKSGSPQTLFDTLKKGVEELEVVTAWGGIAVLRSLASIGRQEGQGAKRKALSYKGKVYLPYDIVPLFQSKPPSPTGDSVWDALSMTEFEVGERRKLNPATWRNARFYHTLRDFSKIGTAELDLQKCRSSKARLFHSFGSLRPSQVTSPVVKVKKAVATAKAKPEVTPQGVKMVKQNSHFRRVERRKELRKAKSEEKGKSVAVEAIAEAGSKIVTKHHQEFYPVHRDVIRAELKKVVSASEKTKSDNPASHSKQLERAANLRMTIEFLDGVFGHKIVAVKAGSRTLREPVSRLVEGVKTEVTSDVGDRVPRLVEGVKTEVTSGAGGSEGSAAAEMREVMRRVGG